MILVELPYLTVAAGIFVCIMYFTAGLNSTAVNGLFFYLAFVGFMWFSVSFGQVIAYAFSIFTFSPYLFPLRSFCGTVAQAAVLNPFFTPFLILFAGVLIPPQTMTGFWKAWMYPLDPYHYFLEGVVTDALKPVTVVCQPSELIHFNLDPQYLYKKRRIIRIITP